MENDPTGITPSPLRLHADPRLSDSYLPDSRPPNSSPPDSRLPDACGHGSSVAMPRAESRR